MLIAVFDCFSDIKWEGVGDVGVGGGRYNLSLSLTVFHYEDIGVSWGYTVLNMDLLYVSLHEL